MHLFITAFTVPFERANVVDIESDSLLLRAGSFVRVKWPRHFLVPPTDLIDLLNSTVNIRLYEVNMSSDTQMLREMTTLALNIPNDGEVSVPLPVVGNNILSRGIRAVTIGVEVVLAQSRQLLQRIPLLPLTKVHIWLGVVYYAGSVGLRLLCQQWANSQSDEIANMILDRVSSVYPCPPTLDRVQAPNSGFGMDLQDSQIWPAAQLNDLLKEFFHPNTHACYRQIGGFE